MAAADRRIGAYVDIAFGVGPISLTTPTVASVNALTRIECGIVTGPDTPRSGTSADISALCDAESRLISGLKENGDITATLYREFDGTDAYWVLFADTAVPPTTNYLVICRAGFTGALGVAAVGNKVDVYQVQITSRSPDVPVRGEAQRFSIVLANVSRAWDLALT